MIDEMGVRAELRRWILDRARAGAGRELRDDTPIVEEGLFSSLDVVELLLFVESLLGEEVDGSDLQPESLASVDALYETFFRGHEG